VKSWGELTWRQEWLSTMLRRDGEDSSRLLVNPVKISVPVELSDAELLRRIARITAREETLQMTYLSDRPGGHAEYTPDLEPPIRRESADSVEELRELCNAMASRPFVRAAGRPLWELVVIEHPDEEGRASRSVCAIFDYQISDGTSLHNFRDALLEDLRGTRIGEYGSYREWVSWQRAQYPASPSSAPTAASEYWRRHLDGTPPDQPTVFPFSFPVDGPLRGGIYTFDVELPVSVAQLKAAGSRLKSPPSILVLAGLASAIGRSAGTTDTILRANTQGRPVGYRHTFGPFADLLPIRVTHTALADPHKALESARSAWVGAMEYLTTPWEYILRTCGVPDPDERKLSTPQVLFNFMPLPNGVKELREQSRRFQGKVGTLQFMIMTSDEKVFLRSEFDSERFAPEGVHEFVDHQLGSTLKQLVD
jgi:hypothetical protein